MEEYRDRLGQALHGVSENRLTNAGINTAGTLAGYKAATAGALTIPVVGVSLPSIAAVGAGSALAVGGGYRLLNDVGVTKMVGLHPDE